MTNEITGPFVSMALLCETALHGADGTISLIRIVDRFQINGPTPEMPPTNIKFTIAVGFKSGFFNASAKIGIRPVSPSGQNLPMIIEPSMLFEGQDRGVNLVLEIPAFSVIETGLYWFDVLLDGTLASRIPLRVLYQRIQPAMGLPGNR